MTNKLFLSTTELAARLDVDASTLTRWARAGTAVVSPQRIGRAYLWPVDGVAAALDQMRAHAEKGRCRRPNPARKKKKADLLTIERTP